MIRRTVGFLLFEGVNSQDVAGPLEAFHSVSSVATSPYDFAFIGESREPVCSESGLPLVATHTLQDIPPLDMLVVPGGAGARSAHNLQVLCPWLQHVAPVTKRVVSVCTGAFLLAHAGLLKGLTVTTHWQYADQLAQEFPDLQVQAQRLFVDHGHIATSAGITAGIDLTLALIEQELGADTAAAVARHLVVHFRRAGDQAQFSAPLAFQQRADQRFASLTGYVLENLGRSLGVADLADYCGMSERSFYRQFTRSMGQTPARYVAELRLDYARQLLVSRQWSLDRIAQACGYDSPDVFRRAFMRSFSVSPAEYRHRFAGQDITRGHNVPAVN
ncbi:GlxA family transcriptional regulator [Alteromonas sp. ASW11-19]|uniref:GlxA family transcriptional regulator n=1 Tax=Alteromonas salexigens TaxID=2982530 RepID=A0ABT2VJ93_9ALTE|nr:GlxA family transcriptional regulator [Alteromonas salexigens]MCU7553291.1 GlxA family transcriptional regulator [Alteromonas salexigens]